MADVLGVSLDYLVGKTDMELDSSTLSRIQEVAKLPEENKKQVFLVIDALSGTSRLERHMPLKTAIQQLKIAGILSCIYFGKS